MIKTFSFFSNPRKKALGKNKSRKVREVTKNDTVALLIMKCNQIGKGKLMHAIKQ